MHQAAHQGMHQATHQGMHQAAHQGRTSVSLHALLAQEYAQLLSAINFFGGPLSSDPLWLGEFLALTQARICEFDAASLTLLIRSVTTMPQASPSGQWMHVVVSQAAEVAATFDASQLDALLKHLAAAKYRPAEAIMAVFDERLQQLDLSTEQVASVAESMGTLMWDWCRSRAPLAAVAAGHDEAAPGTSDTRGCGNSSSSAGGGVSSSTSSSGASSNSSSGGGASGDSFISSSEGFSNSGRSEGDGSSSSSFGASRHVDPGGSGGSSSSSSGSEGGLSRPLPVDVGPGQGSMHGLVGRPMRHTHTRGHTDDLGGPHAGFARGALDVRTHGDSPHSPPSPAPAPASPAYSPPLQPLKRPVHVQLAK